MLISSSRRKPPVYFANALLGKKLASYIDGHDFDIVLTPHLYPAETMTYMKKKNLLHIPRQLRLEQTTPVSHSGRRQISIIM